MILYSIVLIAIILISLNIFMPWLHGVMPQWSNLVGSAVTLSVMAPFLLALSYPVSKKIERERLRRANARFDVPLIVMTIFRFVIALVFVVYLLSAIYSMTIGIAVGVAVFILIMIFFSNRVKNRLIGIENKFLDNLNERELRRSGKITIW